MVYMVNVTPLWKFINYQFTVEKNVLAFQFFILCKYSKAIKALKFAHNVNSFMYSSIF